MMYTSSRSGTYVFFQDLNIAHPIDRAIFGVLDKNTRGGRYFSAPRAYVFGEEQTVTSRRDMPRVWKCCTHIVHECTKGILSECVSSTNKKIPLVSDSHVFFAENHMRTSILLRWGSLRRESQEGSLVPRRIGWFGRCLFSLPNRLRILTSTAKSSITLERFYHSISSRLELVVLRIRFWNEPSRKWRIQDNLNDCSGIKLLCQMMVPWTTDTKTTR